MKVKFYGCRGSIPVCEREFAEFGGNTSCILLSFDNGRIAILDAGTGIRRLGIDIVENGIEQYDDIFIGLSHTHWDHIQGFPFFQPAYDPRRHFTISICGKDRNVEDLMHIFAVQMQTEFFPVPLENMGATFTFFQPDVTNYISPSGIIVTASKHEHPGHSYGYRIVEDNKVLVYCTDVEHADGIKQNVVDLAKDADVLIHDAQYTSDELKNKQGWGHSSWEQAVEVAERAGVKKLVLFHHDPEHDDDFLNAEEEKCQKVFPASVFAREGMEIEI